jgi:tetratricopeptide (TPR) repeat protein
MQTKIVLLLLLLLQITCNISAFDWKELHEKEYWSSFEEILTQKESIPSVENYYMLGLAYLTKHDADNAEKMFEYVLKKYPNNMPAFWGIGEVCRRRYMQYECISILDDIIEIDPSFAPAKISKAFILYWEDKFNKVLDLCFDVLEQGEDNLDTGNRIKAHLLIAGARGRKAEKAVFFRKLDLGLGAMKHLREAKDLNPGDVGVLYAWGVFYLLAPGIIGGDMQKAEEMLMEANKVDPFFVDVYARLAQLFYKRNEIDLANYYITKAYELDSRNLLVNKIKKEYDLTLLK